MKLHIDKQYRITFYNGKSAIVTYAGFQEFIIKCQECGKERWNVHVFLQGDVNNPTCGYFYGSECIKHANITALE